MTVKEVEKQMELEEADFLINVDKIVRVEYRKQKINLGLKQLVEYLNKTQLLKKRGYKCICFSLFGTYDKTYVEDIDNNTNIQIELFNKILNDEIFENKNFLYNDNKTLYSIRIKVEQGYIIILKDIVKSHRSDTINNELKFYKCIKYINNEEYGIEEKIKK